MPEFALALRQLHHAQGHDRRVCATKPCMMPLVHAAGVRRRNSVQSAETPARHRGATAPDFAPDFEPGSASSRERVGGAGQGCEATAKPSSAGRPSSGRSSTPASLPRAPRLAHPRTRPDAPSRPSPAELPLRRPGLAHRLRDRSFRTAGRLGAIRGAQAERMSHSGDETALRVPARVEGPAAVRKPSAPRPRACGRASTG